MGSEPAGAHDALPVPLAGDDVRFYTLYEQNRLPAFDDNVAFRDEDHKYFYRGHATIGSMTGFLHEFFSPFDAVGVSTRLVRVVGRSHELYGMTPEQIRAKWDADRDLGTRMHMGIEAYYNGAPQPDPALTRTVEWRLFTDFERKHVRARGLRPMRTELTVFHPLYELAGQIDMMYAAPPQHHADGKVHVVLYDWKRSKAIYEKARFPPFYGLPPVSHVKDCNGKHYRLQLNGYKYCIESQTDLVVDEMYIVRFHPNAEHAGGYELIEVEDMQKEIRAMLDYRLVRIMRHFTRRLKRMVHAAVEAGALCQEGDRLLAWLRACPATQRRMYTLFSVADDLRTALARGAPAGEALCGVLASLLRIADGVARDPRALQRSCDLCVEFGEDALMAPDHDHAAAAAAAAPSSATPSAQPTIEQAFKRQRLGDGADAGAPRPA